MAAEFDPHAEAIAFSVLAALLLLRLGYCNRDSFQCIVQRFTDAHFISIVSERRDGKYNPRGSAALLRPLAVPLDFNNSVLARGILPGREILTEWHRVARPRCSVVNRW
jgi:hypothetical protein